MNTLEQIVSQHPCPIIRAKIMENKPNSSKKFKNLKHLLNDGFLWSFSKQGYYFWKGVYDDVKCVYNDLKHLDNSYKTESSTPPTPKWLPIDMDNLPTGKVVAIDYPAFNDVYYGTLELTEDSRIRLYIGGGSYLYRLTHYIPLSDLLNLPISE